MYPQSVEIVGPTKSFRPNPRNYVFIAVAILAFLSVVLGCVGLATNNWFEVTRTFTTSATTSSSILSEQGLWRSCVAGSCSDNSYSSFACVTSPSTIRSDTDLKSRIDGTKAMTILGIVFGLLAIICSAFCVSYINRVLWIVTIILILLGTFTYGAAVVVYAHTMDDWANCGHTFCDGIPNCSSKFGYSYGLTAGALAITFVNIFLAIFGNRIANNAPKAVAQIRAGGVVESQMMANTPSRRASFSQGAPPVAATREIVQPAGPATPGGGNVADDEWRFDPTSGMYWSDRQGLYLDQASGRYYDPASEQWYDPTTGAWGVA
eukprot:PhF_6_TR10858/c1_g1_i1/m.17584